MIIKSVYIKQFRGFRDVGFELGNSITVIAGQNGTQKTTVLGLLSQPFSLSNKHNPMLGEKPLCVKNYKSQFKEKFKLSEEFDKPGNHEWTLKLTVPEETEFNVVSIKREKPNEARFWRKGNKSKGAGYIQLPVIYLSLARLHPIGEDKELKSSSNIELTENESILLGEWHNKILIITRKDLKSIDYLESKKKNTLGFNTSLYDWRMNSAGQDNLSKILLAILSFKRLSEKYPSDYKGGILAIDELDATMYPASQLKLMEHLIKFSSNYKIQIIVTTHSLPLIEYACTIQDDPKRKNQVRVVYLYKMDSDIEVNDKATYNYIMNKLNVAKQGLDSPRRRLYAFIEDTEAEMFLKCILKTRIMNSLKTSRVKLGCSNYLQLAEKKIPSFLPENAMIFLDGDVSQNSKLLTKAYKLSNVVVLPGGDSPEKLLATFLDDHGDRAEIWDQLSSDYDHQFCFQNYHYSEVMADRDKAKAWFEEQKQFWGRNGAKLINLWIKNNQTEVEEFRAQVAKHIAKYT